MDIAQKHARTRSLIASVNQPASHSVRQTKKSNILQKDSTLPGDGASYPCIALGGPEEVGASGLGGFVSAAKYPSKHTYTHTNIYTSIPISVDFLAIKANFAHQSICVADSCVFVAFVMWVIIVFQHAH